MGRCWFKSSQPAPILKTRCSRRSSKQSTSMIVRWLLVQIQPPTPTFSVPLVRSVAADPFPALIARRFKRRSKTESGRRTIATWPNRLAPCPRLTPGAFFYVDYTNIRIVQMILIMRIILIYSYYSYNTYTFVCLYNVRFFEPI